MIFFIIMVLSFMSCQYLLTIGLCQHTSGKSFSPGDFFFFFFTMQILKFCVGRSVNRKMEDMITIVGKYIVVEERTQLSWLKEKTMKFRMEIYAICCNR